MPIYGLGPRSQGIYDSLRARILDGTFPPGVKLAPYLELATQYGVAPLTMRHVLAMLEEEGLIARRPGRGTIVCRPEPIAVLIADDEEPIRALLRRHVEAAGFRALEAASPAEALRRLEEEPGIALVLSDLRMPEAEAGVGLIRTIRRRWPDLPVAAVSGFPEDLAPLHGTDEYPILTIPKPFRAHQIDEALRLGLGGRRAAPVQIGAGA